MRQRLLEATTKVLRLRGYAGLRTEEVSEVAGVSRGAQLHHFPTKDSLVYATTEYIFKSRTQRGLARAQKALDSKDPLEAVIQDGMDFFFSDDFFVLLDLVLAGGKNQNFRDHIYALARKYRLPVEAAWLELLLNSGMPRAQAEKVLWLTLSIVRGLSIRSLWQPDKKLLRSVLDDWKDIISGHQRRRNR
jgi:AcrR family transcriptional regulator